MIADNGEPPRAADRTRVALRLSSDYFMRSLELLGRIQAGDVTASLIWLAIIQANVAHLDQSPGSDAYASAETIPPDNLRRPASVLAIADGLGLPYETTRRKIERLIADGECCRVRGGVIVPAAALVAGNRQELMFANMVNLKRLFRALTLHGVDLS